MLDDLLRNAGDRLATGGMSRRRLLGGAAASVAGATVLAGCGDSGGAATTTYTGPTSGGEPMESHDSAGILPRGTNAQGIPRTCGIARGRIHVCYQPWKVVKSEPAEFLPKGVQGVAVRKGPEPDAPIIYKFGKPCVIRIGGVFARQSDRQNDHTGGVAHNCPAPPIRAGRGVDHGFVWGHPGIPADSGTYNKGGWIAAHVDGVTYSEPWMDYPRAMCGPADLDFDCRAGDDPHSKWKAMCRMKARPNDPGFKCNGGSTNFGHCRETHPMTVGIQENIDEFPLIGDLSHERYNLKYQADSTTIFWLVPGDRVERHCYKCTLYNPSPACPKETADSTSHGCCRAYSCVTVLKARYVPAGITGWINSSVLRSPKTGAKTQVLLASSTLPRVTSSTGGYWSHGRRWRASRRARNREEARWLWSESERLVAQVP